MSNGISLHQALVPNPLNSYPLALPGHAGTRNITINICNAGLLSGLEIQPLSFVADTALLGAALPSLDLRQTSPSHAKRHDNALNTSL